MAERKEFIEDWGGAVATLRGCATRKRSAPVKRLPVDGYASSFGGCSAVTNWADLTLPSPPSTNKIVSRVAARVPLSAQWPAHPEILISQGSNAKCL